LLVNAARAAIDRRRPRDITEGLVNNFDGLLERSGHTFILSANVPDPAPVVSAMQLRRYPGVPCRFVGQHVSFLLDKFPRSDVQIKRNRSNMVGRRAALLRLSGKNTIAIVIHMDVNSVG